MSDLPTPMVPMKRDSDVAIRVRNLSKAYRIYQSNRDLLREVSIRTIGR
jgi:hypothetical protein